MSVLEAFNNLNVASARDVSDHEAIFQISYQYLSTAMNFNHASSFKNCIVALIKMDKYYKAVELIAKTPAEITKQFPLEISYVHYKVGDLEKVRAIYESVEDVHDTLHRALKHVLAQALYQAGLVAEALLLYHELVTSSHIIDNEIDLACNERAIIFQLTSQGKESPEPRSSVAPFKQTYDYLLNEALIALAQGNTAKSLQLLEEASNSCNAQNSDLSEEDLLLEIAPIKLTIAYIYQTTGRSEDALSLLKSIEEVGVSDLLIKTVLNTNYYSASPAQGNLNLTQRALNYKYALHNLNHKLTRSQWQVLVKNQLQLSYQTGTLSKQSEYLSNSFALLFQEEFSGDLSPYAYKVLVKLDISLEDLTNESANRAVSRKLTRFVLSDLEAQNVNEIAVAGALLLAHVNSTFGNYDQSIEVLERITSLELASSKDTRLHASIFGTLIQLYEVSNPAKLDGLYKALVDKLETLSQPQIQKDSVLYDFFKAVAFKLLTVGHEEQSASIFKTLLAAKPTDSVVASVLGESNGGLKSVNDLESSTDVEKLLELDIDSLLIRPTTRPRKAHSRTKSSHKVEKKTRKPRLPTTREIKPEGEFDPEKDLDKERWLPMKLRSYYKPSKKDRKKAKGHQGALEASPAPTGESKKQNKKKKKGKK